MQVLERPDEAEIQPTGSQRTGRTRRRVATAGVVVALIAVGVFVGHAVAPTHTVSKTVVVTTHTPATLAPVCAPGAAPGSCNVDEARESLIPDQQLNAATRAELAVQLVAARAAALKYPTVASALAAGYILAGQFSPETGAHYIDIGAATGTFDPSKPGSLIYDGTTPTSKVIGTMFLGGGETAPEGFAGPNDHWHRHANTCVIFGGPKIVVPFAADSSVTAAQCAAVHGSFMKRTTWMVHAWVVPGWESPLGVFSHNNPDVKCANGTEKTNAVGFCQGPGT